MTAPVDRFEFLRGFATARGISISTAEGQWAAKDIPESLRKALEQQGFDAGFAEGSKGVRVGEVITQEK